MTFPKIGLYGCVRWDGAPFLIHEPGGDDWRIDEQVVADHARFGTLIVEAFVMLQRPEIVAALRAENPELRLLAFMDLAKVHATPRTMDPATDLRYEMYAALASVPGGGGILWSAKDGQAFDPEHLPGARTPWSSYAANLACPEAVAAYANVVIERVIKSGIFTGVFFDLAQQSIVWASSAAGDQIDYKRAGFGSLADFDAAYRQGHRDFFKRLHDAAPDGFVIEFNSSTSDPLESAWVTGQQSEGWTSNPGGGHDWLVAMKEIWAREKARERKFLWAENWINATYDGPDAIAFGLASACMTDSARFTCPGQNGRPEPDGRERIWSPLYEPEGWLGEPTSPPLVRGLIGYVYERLFENGLVKLNYMTREAWFYERRRG